MTQTKIHRNQRYETNEEMLLDLATLFRVFGDGTRLQIMMELLKGERNVSDLTEALSMQQSAVSHQLTVLRNMKLVKTRREGKNVFYSLADGHVESILEIGLEHVNE
ncbi:MAG: helix-turn-helix transcriptional regulator [Lachnospiraceae bacterium]|nr:helix-turn-helix transcriptional regulator [Lachnospiraceae bacterium]